MIGIQVCSKEEWKAVKEQSEPIFIESFPYGQYFKTIIDNQDCVFYHSDATKTLSSGACQHAIDKWNLNIVFVLGTCGGVAKDIQIFDIIVAEETSQYDVIPMKKKETLFHEKIRLDLTWIDINSCPYPLLKGFFATADQSVTARNYKILRENNVIAADWETAAIAKIAMINGVRCCVVRGVSDLPITDDHGDGNLQFEDYVNNTSVIMEKLMKLYLPYLIAQYKISFKRSY